MQRKLILMGGKTHVISLPAQWVRKFNISKGQEVSIKENDNQLIISTQDHPKSKSILIEYNQNKILKAYQLGYDEIIIKHPKIKELQHLVNNYLSGFEIIKSESFTCIIKSIFEIKPDELNNMIKRILLLLSSDTQFNKETALKLIYTSKRIINKFGQSSFNQSLILYNLLSKLEENPKDTNSTYETYQKFEAKKLSINDNLQGDMLSLVLC